MKEHLLCLLLISVSACVYCKTQQVDYFDISQDTLIEQVNPKEGITSLLRGILNEVQDINRKFPNESEKSTADQCLNGREKITLNKLAEAFNQQANVTKQIWQEFSNFKSSIVTQNERCARSCGDYDHDAGTSNSLLAKQVECLRRGAHLSMKKLVSGTFHSDTTQKFTWNEAKAACERHGLHLATVDTLGKAKEVYEAHPIAGYGYWVAANDIDHDSGDYRWTDKGTKIHPEMWWKAGYPKAFKVGQETCVLLWGNLLWDHPCSIKDRYLLCELPAECHNLDYSFN